MHIPDLKIYKVIVSVVLIFWYFMFRWNLVCTCFRSPFDPQLVLHRYFEGTLYIPDPKIYKVPSKYMCRASFAASVV